MLSPKEKILWFAFISRIVVLLIQAVSNWLLQDHEANAFISLDDPRLHRSFGDHIIDTLLGGFKRWDAQYFIHIAQYGYTYENCLAFAPLYPLLVKYFSLALSLFLDPLLNFHSQLLLSATIVNIMLFVKSASMLYKLSVKVLKSETRAYKAAVLYCVNPASIFFSAFYSESLFALLSFYTMYKCSEKETIRFASINIMSCIPAGFSIITRSNGILNLGFILYASFKNIVEVILPEISIKFKTVKKVFVYPFLLMPLMTTFFATAMTIALSLLTFIIMQTYFYLLYCTVEDNRIPTFLVNKDYVMPGSISPWCNQTLPLSYQYIQSHYWEVGFLNYYEMKQIPNFLLASPMIGIHLYYCYTFLKRNWLLSMRLGVTEKVYSKKTMKGYKLKQSRHTPVEAAMFVYIVHALCLTIFCVLYVHIQVTTRLLASASPILYWACAGWLSVDPTPTADENTMNEHFRKLGAGSGIFSQHLSIATLEGVDNMYSKWRTFIIVKRLSNLRSRVIQAYFLGYLLIGTILFSNFYPWT